MLSRPARVPNKLRLLGLGHLCELTCASTANIESQQIGDVHHFDGQELVVKNAQVFGEPLYASRYELNGDRFHWAIPLWCSRRAYTWELQPPELEALEGCKVVDRSAAGIEVVDRGVGDRVSKRDPAEDQFVFRDVGKLANRLAPQ